MFRRVIFTVVFYLIGGWWILNAQPGLVSHFSMDDCSFRDESGSNDGISFGPSCECGVSSNGLLFTGGSNFAEFGQGLNDVIRGDWSMSFYIQVQNQGTESVDILFLGERCGLDSLLSLRYLPGSRRFRFILSDSPSNNVQLDGLTDDNSCWQNLVITKDGANVSLYVNGVLADQDASTSDLALNVNGLMAISNSPCQSLASNADVPFIGIIDEFKIFGRALTSREINDAHLNPDKIITRDTTIFQGNSIKLITGGSCSSDFNWSPDEGLDDINLLSPIASPEENTTYTLTVIGDNCQSVDQVTIRIADQSALTCADLILPSAFTPNDDRINDRYGISNQFLISSLQSFEIFNRWGGRVFYTNEISGTWNGYYKGSQAPANSYVYKVVYNCEGQIFNKTGSLNLIR